MCGIAGYVDRRQPPRRETLDAMLRLLDHRGPDSAGAFVDGPAAIGQTRLAVIDLVTGDPPVADESGGLAAVQNGEIYNFRVIRDRLTAAGHRFATSGDTEVIAHLAEIASPVGLAADLDGMFAFAVWDGRRQRLVLGRDRFGKKPLYYWSGSGIFVFASEIKALLAHPDVPNRLAPDAIPAYLHFGYVPTPHTFYDGIRSVPPGHVVVVEGDTPRLEEYWKPPTPGVDGVEAHDLSLHEAASEVRRLLDLAVAKRLVSDVPLGAFLSGGIDSSAVVALMAARLDRAVRTFTIGFEDSDGFDERPWATSVAERFGTEHTEFVVHPDSVDLVERLVWHHDQPFGDSSAIPTFLLAELTRRHVTVALSGDGGDELFGGYERFAAGVAAARAARIPPGLRRAVAGSATRLAPSRLAPKLGRLAAVLDQEMPAPYREWVSYTPWDTVLALAPAASPWALVEYEARWDRTAGAHPLDRLLRLNLDTYLLDDLLPKVDRTSMAVALEVRSPFLDRDLVELALRLPPSTKVRGTSLKRVLKTAMTGLLPDDLLHRPKRGFGVPLDRWFRDDLASYTDHMLGRPETRLNAHLEVPVVERLLAEHRNGTADHGHVLWTLLTLEVFLRKQRW